MKNNASVVYALLLITGDFVALIFAFLAAFILRFRILEPEVIEAVSGRNYAYAIISTLPLWIIVHALLGLYSQGVYNKRFSELGRLLMGSIVGVLAVIGYDFFTDAKLFPGRLVPIYSLILGFSCLFIFRTLARLLRRSLFKYGYGVSNVLIIGDTTATSTVVDAISDTRASGQRILALVGRSHGSIKSYPNFQDAIATLKRPIHSIIQTELFRDQDKNNEILEYAQNNHVAYRFVPGNSDLFVGNIAVELFSGLPMVAVHQTALIGWGRIIKRLFDFFVSLITLTILSPVIVLTWLLVKLSDPTAPAMFRQTRLTRFNREFRVYKFRTHRHGISGLSDEEAFKKLGNPELYEKYKAAGYVLDKDPRISRLGRILRRTSLDELPQLFNVLIGDLSLVGPRALIPEELNTYEKKHAILNVKSGITGLAQISGREDLSFNERRQLDVFYVQNWSFWLDLIIIIRTFRAVISGVGAK